MKLNYLSRLTVLLVAVMMLPIAAFAEGTSIDNVTGDLLQTYDSVTAFVEDGYCSVCAAELVNNGITTWPADGYDCLHTQFANMSASQRYDILAPLATATDDLYWVYIQALNTHHYNDSSAYPWLVCFAENCSSYQSWNPVQPGAANHDEGCPWHDEEYTQDVVGLNPVYGEDGSTIIGYRLILEDANGQLVLVATTDILDTETNYFYFKDITTGLYVAYLHFDNDGNAWVIPLPSEKDLAEN